MYNNAPYLEALAEWGRIAEAEDVSTAALAYRWVCYHSALKPELGDGRVLGGRLPQLGELFEALDQGCLSEKAAKSIQGLWEKLKPNVRNVDNLEAMVGART